MVGVSHPCDHCCAVSGRFAGPATAIDEAVAYDVVIGGALGNILDRIRFHGVTDPLDFYVGTTHWPVFNLADVFVVCGVGLVLIATGREHVAVKKASE